MQEVAFSGRGLLSGTLLQGVKYITANREGCSPHGETVEEEQRDDAGEEGDEPGRAMMQESHKPQAVPDIYLLLKLRVFVDDPSHGHSCSG